MAGGWTIEGTYGEFERRGALADAADRAVSYMDEGADPDEAVARGLDEAFAYDIDRLAAVYHMGGLDAAFASAGEALRSAVMGAAEAIRDERGGDGE